MKNILFASALAIQQVAGHALFQDLWVNGVDKASTCVRLPSGNSPVSSVNSNDLRCNAGGSKGVSGKCAVQAGDTVTVEMHQVRFRTPFTDPMRSLTYASLSNPATATARTRPSAECITDQ
jgi:hypothetical protein